MFGLNRNHLCALRGNLFSHLSLVAKEFYDLMVNNRNDLNSWVHNISSLIKHFDNEHANLLGFCYTKFGWLVDKVYADILIRFPHQVALTNIEAFENKIKELSDFCRLNPTTNNVNADIQRLFRNL